mmetsp:Transcript_47451/g.109847  ORF Transcript_47451/g.109847 Transcript_47451/m.109847 type:complete len:382 (+) Transcript_47451:536-1681(+)
MLSPASSGISQATVPVAGERTFTDLLSSLRLWLEEPPAAGACSSCSAPIVTCAMGSPNSTRSPSLTSQRSKMQSRLGTSTPCSRKPIDASENFPTTAMLLSTTTSSTASPLWRRCCIFTMLPPFWARTTLLLPFFAINVAMGASLATSSPSCTFHSSSFHPPSEGAKEPRSWVPISSKGNLATVARLLSCMTLSNRMPSLRPSWMCRTTPGRVAVMCNTAPSSSRTTVATESPSSTMSPGATSYFRNRTPTSWLRMGPSLLRSQGKGGNSPTVAKLRSSTRSMRSPGLTFCTAVTIPSFGVTSSSCLPVSASFTTAMTAFFLTMSPICTLNSTSFMPSLATAALRLCLFTGPRALNLPRVMRLGSVSMRMRSPGMISSCRS